MGIPSGLGAHRRTLRTTALELHRLASLVRDANAGTYLTRYPRGFQDAYAARLRETARLCENLAQGGSIAEAKARLLQIAPATADAADKSATQHAIATAMGTLASAAQRNHLVLHPGA